MEDIRRLHNDYKRHLIQSVAIEGQHILDVGAGFGGDLQKWHSCKVNINMCDPSREALEEAKRRAKNMKMRVNFYEGDIFNCPNRKYDIICYNFSLHYIFQSAELFFKSLREIKKRMKPRGKLIGIIPDSQKIIFNTPLNDELGNFFLMKATPNGGFGEKLFVNLVDTPYYAEGAKSEPIAYRDLLWTELEKLGFKLRQWEGLKGNPISELYSSFVFEF
jgi:ubiquinone/menaquinone biosynthesis C-methylase UbiE